MDAGRYWRTVSAPGAWRFVLPGMLARFPIGMTGISILLFVSDTRQNYGVAGALTAASAIGYAVAAPQLARLSDRVGQRRVLLSCAVVCAASGTAFVTSVQRPGAPVWVLFATAVTMGAATPAIGSMVRARWSALLEGSTLKVTAFALESVIDEVIFIVGPVVATVLATAVSPAAGVITSLVLICGGSVLLSLSERTEPPRKTGARDAGSALFLGPVAVFAGINLCFGGIWGAIDIATVSFSAALQRDVMVGVLLAVYAVGGLVGGLAFGARDWPLPMARIVQISILAMTAGLVPMLLVQTILQAGVVLLVAGIASAPAMIAAMTLVADGVPASRRTEAMAWQSTALWLGVASGSSAGGHLADSHGASAAYAFAIACGAVGFVITMVGRRLMDRHQAEPAAPPLVDSSHPTEVSNR
ncbi:MFS transporter [Micromonospora marina]|uniref:MFS transporter n=1 Tax=Micromonospora marina TaxID=307120 RepID=UPI003D717378